MKKKNFCLFRRRLLAEGNVDGEGRQEERERHKSREFMGTAHDWTRVTDNVDSDKEISPGRWPF